MAYLLLAAVASLVFGYVYYMTVLHPLAKYPGPFLAKFTDLHSVWLASNGLRHLELQRLHRIHGDYVRWAPNKVSINRASALEQIHGNKVNVKKSTFYTCFSTLSMFSAIDKDVHARKKRVISHAFSTKALREIQPYIVGVVRDWCAALGDCSDPQIGNGDDSWSSPKDMRQWSAYNIFDILGELLFGQSFKTATSAASQGYLQGIATSIWMINTLGQMPSLRRLRPDLTVMRSQVQRQRKQNAFAVATLKKRLALGPDSNGRRDIVHYLQSGIDPETGEAFPQGELIGETTLLVGAGSDTTNTALSSILYYLVHHPDILARLSACLRETFASVDDIEGVSSLASITYLQACIDEAMRLSPPIPMLLPREVCSGGLDVDGHHFDEGTVVGVPTYTLHHDSRYFDNPLDYNPSRWIVKGEGLDPFEGNDPDTIARQRQAFVPFGMGPRICIAKNVALFSLSVSIARVVYMYDLRLAPGMEHVGVGPHGVYKIKDFFLATKEGPVLQFRRREDAI